RLAWALVCALALPGCPDPTQIAPVLDFAGVEAFQLGDGDVLTDGGGVIKAPKIEFVKPGPFAGKTAFPVEVKIIDEANTIVDASVVGDLRGPGDVVLTKK